MGRVDRNPVAGISRLELLVGVVIASMVIALGTWGVQKVREAGARAQCVNNLRQLALATLNFSDRHGRMPTYNGIFPVPTTGDTSQLGNRSAVYGSYIVHLLPDLDQVEMYNAIRRDVQQFTNTGVKVGTIPGTPAIPGGPIITAATAAVPAEYDTAGLVYRAAVPATYDAWNAVKVSEDYYVASPQSQNGAIIWLKQSRWVPAQFADPGTGISAGWYSSTGQRVTPPIVKPAIPATPAVYGPPGPPQPAGAAKNIYAGVFRREIRGQAIPLLNCPSDPSPGTDANAAAPGRVYSNAVDGEWASTNYLANWNVLTTGSANLGYKAPPRQMDGDSIPDGASNTILFAEAYAWCDGLGRSAFVAWHEIDPSTTNTPNGGMSNLSGVHNFGLTYALQKNKIQAGDRPAVEVIAPRGFPNPSGTPELIFDLQIRPRPLPVGSCPKGADCCNALSVQSGHSSGLNVALADGSVRTLQPGLSLATWRSLLLPADGEAILRGW